MPKYEKKDAAKETKTSTSETSRAWHQARDDAAVAERTVNKVIKGGVSAVRKLFGLDDK